MKFAKREQVDLAPFMDPARRAVEAADLNLKLMRWRCATWNYVIKL